MAVPDSSRAARRFFGDWKHPPGNEDQQFFLGRLLVGGLEQVAEQGQIPKERYFGQVLPAAELIHAADDDGLTVIHQDRRADFALADLRHCALGRFDEASKLILLDLENEVDATILRDRRRHQQFKNNFLERHRVLRGATLRLLLCGVANLIALLDARFALVGGNDAWAGDHFTASFLLQC